MFKPGPVIAILLLGASSAAGNVPPDPPTFLEPTEGATVSAYDPHYDLNAVGDPDGDAIVAYEFEVWDDVLNALVWSTGPTPSDHVHNNDGVFLGPLAGETRLAFGAPYRARARAQDDSGSPNSWSDWGSWVSFQTAPATAVLPMLVQDFLPSPPATLTRESGSAIGMPSGSFIRLEYRQPGTWTPLYRADGTGSGIAQTDFAGAPGDVPFRVVYGAGDSSGLAMPDVRLSITDNTERLREIFLDEVDLPTGDSLLLWVSEFGATYFAQSDDTVPDFSDLSQDLFVPWQILDPGFEIERVASNLYLPVNIAFVPNPGQDPMDPLFYVTELYGKVKVFTRDGTVLTYADSLINFNPTGDFPGTGEIGTTGICVEPTTGDLFVTGVFDSTGQPFKWNRVLRLYSSPDGLAADSMRVIRVVSFAWYSHQIQACTIGPDGKLYVQNADQNSPDTTVAQNPNDLRGKVLRMNLDGSAPPDNPYGPTNIVWAVGFRNPFGGVWRGGELYVTDNGPGTSDRTARVSAGVDYGWCCTFQNNLQPFQAAGITGIATSPGLLWGDGYSDDLFVGLSGPTYALGVPNKGKNLWHVELDAGGSVADTSVFCRYVGAGYGTVVGVAFGPDGLYFTDLYGEAGIDTSTGLTNANIYRILRTDGTGVGSSDPTPSGIRLMGPAFPNPTRGSVAVLFRLAEDQNVQVDVFDASGRRIAGGPRFLTRGEHRVMWDGRDSSGRLAASGAYFFRISPANGPTAAARITIIR